jgi:hypothetical protein
MKVFFLFLEAMMEFVDVVRSIIIALNTLVKMTRGMLYPETYATVFESHQR